MRYAFSSFHQSPKPLRRYGRTLLAALGLGLSLGAIGIGQEKIISPTDNLVVDGLPAIPADLAEQVRRYTESRSAAVLDWHPTRKEMLISTRFGNSNQVHLVKFAGGDRKQITFFNEPVGAASFSPKDGSYFLFTKDVGGNEFAQIFRYDFADGKVTLLTDGKRSQNGGWRWSNSKDRIVYGSTSRNGADRDLWLLNPTDPSSNRLLIELQGGGWAASDWSPDDKQLVVLESLSVNKSNVFLVDVATGKKTPLTAADAQVAYSNARFSSDGKGVYLTSDEDSEFQRLVYLDLATKKITPLITDLKWDVEGFELSPDGKKIVLLVNEAGVSKVLLFDIGTQQYRAIEGLPSGVISGGEWHEDSESIAFSISSARSTSDVYVLNSKTGAVERWTESELGGLVADELSEPELIRWKSFDGLEISGFYYAPPKKFIGKRPVIINIHGGPEGQSRPLFLGRNNYFLNELGVAIIYPNVRGSTGYGKSYVKLDNGFKREDSVKDISSLIDWIEKSEQLDASRIMVTGGSYGGYMTLAVATHENDRIRCALDVVGISHFGTFLKNTESYRRDLRRVEYGDERDPAMAAFFEKMAPLNNASKITKPLFVVQGGNDPRVPLSEAEQMVAKVKAGGGNVWYLMAKDEGHGFRKKNNADFQFYATILFVQEHLIK